MTKLRFAHLTSPRNEWYWRLDSSDFTNKLSFWQGPFESKDDAESAAKSTLEAEREYHNREVSVPYTRGD